MKLYLKDVRETVKKTERKVSQAEVVDAFYQSPLKNLQCLPLDREYWVLPKETWELILKYSKLDRIPYRPERQDCDDFAINLKSEVSRKLQLNSVGMVIDFSGGHAYTALAIDDYPNAGDLSVVGVEPQTDRLHVAASNHQMYAADSGYVQF